MARLATKMTQASTWCAVRGAAAPFLDDIETLSRQAWAPMPAAFRTAAANIVARVEDFADDETLADLGIEGPFRAQRLLPARLDLIQRPIADPRPSTPMVVLLRRAILDEWIERGNVSLGDLVAHVLPHEVGRHFGLSDERMDEILER